MTANWLVPALRRVAKHRDPGHTWRDLFQQFQPFSAEGVFRSHEAGDVAARLRQAVDEAGPDRIAGDREHDRHAAGRLQQRPHGRRAMRQDDVGRERSQFCGMPADIVGSAARPVRVDAHVAADDPARLCQRLLECAEPGLIVGVVCARWQQHADAPHALALLRARRERPRGRRTAKCGQQFSPSDGDCHTPLPREVREGNDTTPRACSLAVQGGQDAGCFHLCRDDG